MTILIALVLAPLILLTLCFATELFCGIAPLTAVKRSDIGRSTAVIVVPAHDEESVIAQTLPALTKVAVDPAQILLIADNCSDATAEVARRHGVSVIERNDPERRGKGFALDAARQALRSESPNVVVVVDADCFTDANSLRSLIALCAASGRPCQARYVQVPSAEAAPTVQLSTFAFFIKNVIRQRALQRIAGRVHLVGTGMAFPWLLFEGAALASDNIVEDMELGLELAGQGAAPLLVENAVVWSDAATASNTIDQRRRWEGGFLQSAARWGPQMLSNGLRRADVRQLWAALNLFVPPFALLLLLDFCALITAAIVTRTVGAAWWPVGLLLTALCLAAAGLVAGWCSGGSRFVTFKALAQAPLYVLWKIPLYLGFARKGAPTQWVRTGRE